MTADDFVNRLRASQPTRESLLESGVPEELVDETRRSFCFIAREHALGLSYDCPVMDLVDRYDSSFFDIGSIRFRDIPDAHGIADENGYIIFADFDADLIAKDKRNRVLLLDGCDPSFVMMTLAENGGRFLEALILLVEARQRGDNPTEIARRCAVVAGSEKAVGFFEMLTG